MQEEVYLWLMQSEGALGLQEPVFFSSNSCPTSEVVFNYSVGSFYVKQDMYF